MFLMMKKIRHQISSNRQEVTTIPRQVAAAAALIPDIKRILEEEVGRAAEPKEPPAMTKMKRIKLVTSVIETKIDPTLRNDGGDIELIDVDGVDVYVKLRGACAGCPGAKATLHNIVQETLRAEVDRKITIIEVK